MTYEAKLKELQDRLEIIKGSEMPCQSTATFDFGQREAETGAFI